MPSFQQEFSIWACKNWLLTNRRGQLSIGPAYCFISVSHSNKLYSPLLLPHIWKFFPNPCPDHDSYLLLGVFTSFVWSLCAYNNIKCDMPFPLLICCQFNSQAPHTELKSRGKVFLPYTSSIASSLCPPDSFIRNLMIIFRVYPWGHKGFPESSVGKESPCNAGDPSSILGWEDLLEWG